MKSLVECLLEEGLVKFDNKEIVSKEEALKLLSTKKGYHLAFKGVKFDSGVYYMLKGKTGQLEIYKTTDNDNKPCFNWYCAVGGNDDSGFLCYADEAKSVDELIKKCYDKEIFASLENISSIAKALNSNKIEIYHDA
jgi:hypothetical protein